MMLFHCPTTKDFERIGIKHEQKANSINDFRWLWFK